MTSAKFAFGIILAALLAGSTAQAADSILINFSSDHCAHCRAMEPTLAQLEQSGVPVRHVNVSRERDLALRFGIRKTPTFVVVSGGNEVTRIVGTASLQELQNAVAINRSGPLIQTAIKRQSVAEISAPRTRLAPITQPSAVASVGNTSFGSKSAPAQPISQPAAAPAAAANPPAASDAPQTFTSVASANATVGEPMPTVTLADAVERAEAATVRLRVHDGHGFGVGTGTIIDVHGEEALVLTCGHLFRETQGKGKIEIDIFVGGQTRTVEGQVIDYDADARDIALVAMRPGFAVQPVKVIGDTKQVQTGQAAFSFGCDRGADPSRRDTRVTGIDKYNQHLGVSNLEIAGAPIDGRSGGGLFDQQGTLIGVCNAADYKGDVGIYTGPGSVKWQLDRVDLAHLYQSTAGAVAVAPTATPPANRIASLPGGDTIPAGNRGVMPVSAVNPQAGFVAPAALPASPAVGGGQQEVIVIVRDPQNPEATGRVMTLQNPTAELMQMIQQQSR